MTLSNWYNNLAYKNRKKVTHVFRFTAQIPLRMHKTPLYVTLAGALNSHRLLSLLWTLLIYTNWTTSPRLVPAPHQPPGWLEYGYDGDTYIMSQPLNKGCPREVERLKTRWFLCYRCVCLITTITCHSIWMTCQLKVIKIQHWKLARKPLRNQSDGHGNHHSVYWEIILHVYMTDLNTWQTGSASQFFLHDFSCT